MSATTAKSEIGHFARIPLHIAHAQVSEMAKAVWRELAFISSPQKPKVWVRQESLATTLGVCTKTIQRALKELVENGLLEFVGFTYGRYKTYLLAWKNFFLSGGQNCPPSMDMNVQVPKTTMSNDPGHVCPPIVRVPEQSKNQIISSPPTNPEKEAEAVLEKHEKEFEKRFPSLDGRAGRPTLKTSIEQALNHISRHKYANLKIYLEMWLQNAQQKWHWQYVRDEGVYVESDQEKYRRLNWEQIRHEKEVREVEMYFNRKS